MAVEHLNLAGGTARTDPSVDAKVWVEAARIAAQQGDAIEAKRLLQAAVTKDPNCAEAWLGLAWLAESRRERASLLHRVLAIEPENARARAELERLRTAAPPPGAEEREPRSRRLFLLALPVLIACLLLVGILLWGPVDESLAWLLPTATPTVTPTPTMTPAQIAAQFQPQLEAAIANENWDRALEIVDIMHSVDPEGDAVRQWALQTYVQYGQALVAAGDLDAAQVQFDRAVATAPHDGPALTWQRVTSKYRQAQQALETGDWDTAIQLFALAQQQMPDFADVGDRLLEAYRRKGLAALEAGEWTVSIEALTWVHERAPEDEGALDALAEAYAQRGIAHQEADRLQKARRDLETALSLRPNHAEAQAHLDEVMYILFPPKRIEIDISEQRFYAWEGDRLVYKFRTSTGVRGRDTAVGRFKVLSKIPMAYSSIWRLKMPYWLGIYYVGRVENGIHALPIRPDGSVMWGGLLGQRASYGCVILSTQAAKTIYNWAEIGTRVDIHY